MALAGIQKLIKFPIVFIVLGVLVFGFACAGFAGHAPMHSTSVNAAALNATGQQKCCTTTISKYIGSWKDNLLATPREARDVFTSLALGFMLMFALAHFPFRRDADDRELADLHLYAREHPEAALFDHVRLVFSRGILHSRIYDSGAAR